MDDSDVTARFRLGDWLVHPDERRISRHDESRELTQDELALLLALAQSGGEAVDRKTLKARIWPDHPATDVELGNAIRGLRKALGDDPRRPQYIRAVPRRGYTLGQRCEPLALALPIEPAAGAIGASKSVSSRLESLVIELKRRHVFRVAGAYLIGIWVVLQVAEVTFEPLQLPEWWITALTILAVLGLPIVLVVAWAYEITPGGIVLDEGGTGGLRLPRARRRALAPVVLAGVTLMAGVTGYAWWQEIRQQAVPQDTSGRVKPSAYSIAVLPLVDMSPAGEAAYLGDGLSEELSSDLAKLPGLRVAARTSSFAFRGKEVDVRSIGEQLGVRYVLEGSVRREGDRVRITAQLIDAATGFHVWTESYDRSWQDLIAIQQDISNAIAEQLRVVLTPEEAARLKTAPTVDPRAYDFYLAGLAEFRAGGTSSRYDEAANLFERALEIAPGFARAQAGLCQVGITRYLRSKDPEEMHAAEASCRAALESETELPETEAALAMLYTASGRLEQAEAVYRSLLRRAPRDAEAHIGLGNALAAMRREREAEDEFREAIAVEPGYWKAYSNLGNFLFSYGRAAEAVDAYRRVTELAPSNSQGFNNLGAALLTAGELEQAAKAFERSMAIEPGSSAVVNLGTVYYYTGRMEEAVAMYTKAIELAPKDAAMWGARGDALWNIPSRRPEAEADYRRAVALAEQSLAINDSEAETWALLGFFYARLGDAERSERYKNRALQLGPQLPMVSVFAGLTAAHQGNRQEASRLTRLAIEQGYPRLLIAREPALKGIPVD